jgi:hypothetical protein
MTCSRRSAESPLDSFVLMRCHLPSGTLLGALAAILGAASHTTSRLPRAEAVAVRAIRATRTAARTLRYGMPGARIQSVVC